MQSPELLHLLLGRVLLLPTPSPEFSYSFHLLLLPPAHLGPRPSVLVLTTDDGLCEHGRPVHVHRAALLDVRHLADAGDGVETGGESVAGLRPAELAVDVALHHADEALLDHLDPPPVLDRAEVHGEEDDVGQQGHDDLISDLREDHVKEAKARRLNGCLSMNLMWATPRLNY